MNKSRHVTFRCTQEQYEIIKKCAGKNVSQWIVDTLFLFKTPPLGHPDRLPKDKHIIMDEYEVKDNGELKHIRRKTTPLKDKS